MKIALGCSVKSKRKQNEVMRNHRRQSQQSRLELGLRLSRGFGGGEQSGLLMRTVATEKDTLPMRMKSSLRL